MTIEIISWSISTKVWDRAGIEVATPGSAVRRASVVRHVTICMSLWYTRNNISGYCDMHSWAATWNFQSEALLVAHSTLLKNLMSWLKLYRYLWDKILQHQCYRGSYMSVHVLLNLLNELGKRDKMRGLPSILSLFRNEFNKFNKTRARMLDSIYHMTLR